MRRRSVLAAIAVAAAAVSVVPSPADGASRARSDGRLVRIAAPSDERLVTGDSVVLRFTARRGTGRVRAFLDRRNLTGRLTRRGNRYTARVSLRGLRPGPHRLLVKSGAGRRSEADDVHVFVGRRVPSLVSVSTVRTARAAVPVRIRVPRLARRVTVTLNGRDASRALWPLLGARRSGDLSPSEGLRFGRNVLRVLALNDDGRYDVERRVIRVSRRQPLASAGRNRQVKVRDRVRLDGRRSLPRGARRRKAYSWRVARAPKGSKAKLRRGGTARPIFKPDRPGTYVVRLTVRERRRGRGTASAAAAGSADTAVIQAGPPLPPIGWAIDTLDTENGQAGISYGPNFAANTGPSGSLQILVLDNQTLVDESPGTNYYDLSSSAGVSALASELSSPQASNALVVLAGGASMTSSTLPAVNQALASIGVAPLPAGSTGPFSAIGVQGAAASSMFLNARGALNGYINQSFTPSAPPVTTKQLPSAILGYTFVYGGYEPFQLASSGDIALVRLGPTELPFTNPGTTGAIAAQVVDAQTLQPAPGGDVYQVNDPAIGVQEQQRLANMLNGYVDNPYALVALQSIGTVVGPAASNGYNPSWSAISAALGKLGATQHLFNTVDGGYSFLGGPGFAGPPAESATKQSGQPSSQLQGVLGLNNVHSTYEPLLHDPLELGLGFNYELLEIAYQAPTPWPNEGQADYDAAYDWVSEQLSYPDVRSSYLKYGASTWSDAYNTLTDQTINECPTTDVNFTQAVCKQQVQEIANELLWVQAVQGYFPNIQQPLDTTGAWSYADLSATFGDVEQSVSASQGSDVVADIFDVLSEILWTASFFVDEADAPVLGVFGAATSIASTFTTNLDGSGVLTNELQYDVSQLGLELEDNYVNTLLAYDQVEAIILSDYAKLSTVGQDIGGLLIGSGQPSWEWDLPDSTDEATAAIEQSTTVWSYGQLMPLAWPQWLVPNTNYDGSAVTPLDPWHWICNYDDVNAYYPFSALNSLSWFLAYQAEGPQMWMIGKNTSSTFNEGNPFDFPSTSLVGGMNAAFNDSLLMQAQFWAREFDPQPLSSASHFLDGCSD